ncbi:phospholipase D-like domain-containing protein [Alkalicoccobacillus porphyridii]|uniref:Phospholipase n=1 Tax=Alkalicoccobacillus porphyridii TaxID=2597270 RepID=A0A554A375_9BACI|nr:phospholipase D-like domain-containing protein [Alkalicoccobacillus porphyridii]TSB48142.1 phospholipase [Alkalicoccobacillus porphyridii]
MSGKLFNKKYAALLFILAFLFIYIGNIIHGVNRPLPHTNISYESELKPVYDPVFLSDITHQQMDEQILEQDIFEYIKQMIQEADDWIVFDMFLFNNIYQEEESFPALAEEMTAVLIQKKQSNPDMEITVITDPVNTMYGAFEPDYLAELQDEDIPVIISDLTTLRDSNPLFASYYKMFLRWDTLKWGNWLPNPLGSNGHDVNLHSYFGSLNGKANHRKVVVTENEGLITSGNPHNASAYHNNTAIAFKGELVWDLLLTEEAVANYSANRTLIPNSLSQTDEAHTDIYGQVLTESKIHKKALSMINEAEQGDTIWMGMLYLSESLICDALVEAAHRGVSVQIVLDQNIESFGNQKIGLPNKPVAYRLLQEANSNLQIRWYETEKEQYHPKLLFVDSTYNARILNGSANFTRRNLEDLNLETNLYLQSDADADIANDIREYFHRIWNNQDGQFTADYEEYKDEALWLRALYSIQKLTKLSTY